ncbi:condensation domain-containing protein [Micromonospora sp. CA-259024]|uniref:condensation domain-containing protein n=1 Tax=Micromonospora sp. CA-259024 TaxID=3239965 RepID=UPI003D89F703
MSVPLSFGQLSVFRAMQVMPLDRWSETYLTNVIPLPSGCTAGDVTAALEGLAQRHESLRTSFFDTPHGPRQTVSTVGRVELRSVDLPGCAVDEVWTLSRDWCRPRFDWEAGSCWRAVIVTDHGTPAFLTYVGDHIVSDGWGLHRLAAEVRAMLGAGSEADHESLAEAPVRPRDLAVDQRSDLWQPRRMTTGRYWEGLLRDLPSDVFPWPVPAPDDAGRIGAVLRSGRGRWALGRAAHRIGASPHSVLLALYAVAARQVLGVDDLALTLQSGNRRELPWRNVVSSMNQYAPLPLVGAPVTGEFAVMARWMHQASRTAYSHGMYDVDVARDLVERERGVELTFDCFFNYLARDIRPQDDGAGQPGDLAAAVVERVHPNRQVGPRLDMMVRGGAALEVTVRVDPTLLPGEQLDRLMLWIDDELWALATSEQSSLDAVAQRCVEVQAQR